MMKVSSARCSRPRVLRGCRSQIPITATASRAPVGTRQNCGILNLALGPINLNLLGLQVNTSPICLTITAYQGGGLLGDLLCSVANLLNNPSGLAQLLNQILGILQGL